MFYVIYDTVWFVIVHTLCYRGVDIFFRDYSQALKPIAGIDSNHFNYNMENGLVENHKNLFWTSIPFSFMFSVIDLNRILFYILLFKVASKFHIFLLRFDPPFRPHSNLKDFLLTTQIIFTCLSYSDTRSVIPTLFQLADEFTGVGDVMLEHMLETHNSLIRSDTHIKAFIYKQKVRFVTNRKYLYWGKFTFMTSLFLYNLMYVASLTHPLETAFCYYSAVRVMQIFTDDIWVKRA
jgi:hypothetical protein